MVTNRHVAEEFATRRGEGFTFKTGPTGAPMSSSVDFLEEIDNPAKLVFNLVRPLYIEDSSGRILPSSRSRWCRATPGWQSRSISLPRLERSSMSRPSATRPMTAAFPSPS